MKRIKPILASIVTVLTIAPVTTFAASHREAPITALDHAADITDFYAFVSYDNANNVTFLLDVDPLLEPANGPTYFPFDPDILYAIRIDNTMSGLDNIVFEFRFTTEFRAPGVFTAYVGAGTGINAPANAPLPLGPGTPIVPPAVTALDGAGSQGLNLRQSYTVTMVKGGVRTPLTNSTGAPLFAVPTNVGPRTMPNYPALAVQGIYSLGIGIRVFAGTVDDPFYIDLGAAFDSLNFRMAVGGGVLTAAQDTADSTNFASDSVSGYNVNTIALEVPITMLTSTGTKLPATNAAATIGGWGTTSRARVQIRRAPFPAQNSGSFSQIQRMGNALINELIIGIGSKDAWSMSQPVNDSQFANFPLDPLLARVFNAVYGINIPAPPRTDLLPLVQYFPGFPAVLTGTPTGPIADLLRLNTGVPPTPMASRKRLGVLAGDAAGYPNGRRVSDDVTDISARAVAGVLCGVTGNCVDSTGKAFLGTSVPLIGDGVNTNDMPYQETFPYAAFAQSGRNRRHIDPGEAGCTMNGGAPCPLP